MDEADQIWNRACDPFSPMREPGDRALQAVLLVHGQVMNGGLASAMEYRSAEEVEAAIAGFEYFGRDELGQVLRDALDGASYERLEQLEATYNALVPRDDVLEDMFRLRLRKAPRDFARLD